MRSSSLPLTQNFDLLTSSQLSLLDPGNQGLGAYHVHKYFPLKHIEPLCGATSSQSHLLPGPPPKGPQRSHKQKKRGAEMVRPDEEQGHMTLPVTSTLLSQVPSKALTNMNS